MDNHSHHNTALYYIWENNCSSPSACFFDLQKGDICVLGRNDGYKVIYIDKPINSSAIWSDFHVIDSLTEYNLNLPKEHEILCMTGGDKAEGNEIVLRRLIDCCKNEWIKDFFIETKSVLSGITEFWNLRQLMRLTGDYGLMYIPVAKVSSKEIKVVSSGNSLYYIPEVDSLGEELISKNVESGDFCICRKGNGLVFFAVNHKPVSTDNLYSFPEIETVGETDIMFPLVFLQLCKNGVKKEKNTKFINRFKSAFNNRKSLEILELALKIVQGENVSLPHVNCAASIHNDVPEYENFVVEKVPSYEQNTVSQESEGVEKCTLAFKNLPEDVQLDIEIEFLKCIREQSDTRKRFRSKFSSVASFYSFVQNAEKQKSNLSDTITSVYINLLNRIVNTLEGSSCEKSIVKVFTDAIEELQRVEVKVQADLSPFPFAKENRRGDRWTTEEEQLVVMYFNGGYSPKEIAKTVGRSEESIYMRLDKLGLIQYSHSDYHVEEPLVSKEQKEKIYNEESYGGIEIEHIYLDNAGRIVNKETVCENHKLDIPVHDTKVKNSGFFPKGKLGDIDLFVKNQYDVLWLMSLVDIIYKDRLSEEFTLEQIACMEIANLWELQNADKTLNVGVAFEDCKKFLSAEISVNEKMNNYDIYKAIKNYPICGEFEDFIDILTENSHLKILKAWIDESDETTLINKASVFTNACLFSVTKQKYETKVKLNPSWRYYLINNMRDLKKFYLTLFYKFY